MATGTAKKSDKNIAMVQRTTTDVIERSHKDIADIEAHVDRSMDDIVQSKERLRKLSGKKAASDDGLTPEERVERDAARYEELAREHGADLSEEGFNAVLTKVGRGSPQSAD